MFNCDWNRLPFTTKYPIDSREITRPHSLERMLAAAARLAGNIPFVRVDFYEIDNAPRFGEMTFFPGAGFEHFIPEEYDRKIGDLWKT